ncbi:MAG TPA: NUDIX hydrolase [Actinomycetota bacterium]|nr:NUDIX hydrolase [Actinomycetota bacterium]
MPDPEDSARAYEGRFVRVDRESWGSSTWEVVRRQGPAAQGAVAVVALTPADRVILVRVFRPPIRTALLEIPAGLLDREDEDALSCARRELREETGYRASKIEFLGGWYSSAGMTDEYVQAFLARTDEEPEGPTDGEVEEVVTLAFEEAVARARAGRVRDAKTALSLLLAAERRSRP